jgi:hypothetical protein
VGVGGEVAREEQGHTLAHHAWHVQLRQDQRRRVLRQQGLQLPFLARDGGLLLAWR